MAVSAIDGNNGGRRSNAKEKHTSRKKLSVEDEAETRRRTTPTVLRRNAKNNEGIETPRAVKKMESWRHTRRRLKKQMNGED